MQICEKKFYFQGSPLPKETDDNERKMKCTNVHQCRAVKSARGEQAPEKRPRDWDNVSFILKRLVCMFDYS